MLITGSGVLGHETARWAADRGANRIVLASIRGDPDGGALEQDLAERGIALHRATCDVTDRTQLTHLLDELDRTGPPSAQDCRPQPSPGPWNLGMARNHTHRAQRAGLTPLAPTRASTP